MKSGYRKLIVWQKADDLAVQIYQTTKIFPREEMFGVTSQLRRASMSVPSNICEGSGRQNPREVKQFANIALGSLAETEYLLWFALRVRLISADQHAELENLRSEVGRLLWRFYKSL